MSWSLSQLVWTLAAPSNVLPCLALLGSLLLARGVRWLGALVLSLGLGGLIFAGLSPIANVVLLPLEQRFPPFADDARPIDGIIVLSGAIEPSRSAARREFALNGAAERVVAFLALARRHPEARLVYTGGGAPPGGSWPPEATIAAERLAELGLPESRLTVETASMTTWENARETRALLGGRSGERWLLVTSAWHMPRAIGCFRQVGLEVIPYPVDYQTLGPGDALLPFSTVGQGLQRLDLAAREWIGLAAYRLTGRSGELFPRPGRPGSLVAQGAR